MSKDGRSLCEEQIIKGILGKYASEKARQEFGKYDTIVETVIRPIFQASIWSHAAIRENVLNNLYIDNQYCFVVRRWLQAKSIWRHTLNFKLDKETESAFATALRILSERLGEETRYFGGDEMSWLDACIAPDLVLLPFFLPVTHKLHQLLTEHNNLYDYAMNMFRELQIDK